MHLSGKLIEYSISWWKFFSIFVGTTINFCMSHVSSLWIIRLMMVIVNKWSMKQCRCKENTVVVSSKSAIPMVTGIHNTYTNKKKKKKWQKSKKLQISQKCTSPVSATMFNLKSLHFASFYCNTMFICSCSTKMVLRIMAMWSCIGISLNSFNVGIPYMYIGNKMGIDGPNTHTIGYSFNFEMNQNSPTNEITKRNNEQWKDESYRFIQFTV